MSFIIPRSNTSYPHNVASATKLGRLLSLTDPNGIGPVSSAAINSFPVDSMANLGRG